MDEFVNHQKYLNALERKATGSGGRNTASVENLKVMEMRQGQYRTNVDFQPSGKRKLLPSHNISSGDNIHLQKSGASPTEDQLEIKGTVISVSCKSISISFKESLDLLKDDLNEETFYDLVKFVDDTNFDKLDKALEQLRKKKSKCSEAKCYLQQILLGLRSPTLQGKSLPSTIIDEKTGKINFYNKQLNNSQKEAVEFALCQKQLSVVHGPPGTGKTTTVVEIITQAVRCGEKVLLCAPSNTAVDNILEKLANNGMKDLVRLGDPARVREDLQKHTLDAKCLDKKIQKKALRLQTLNMEVRKTKMPGEKKAYRKKIRILENEIKRWERSAFKETLSSADVILSTLMTASPSGPLQYVPQSHFQLTVIDECSQAKEMECWMAIPRSPKLILAGDHKQLPPTILSTKAAKEGLSKTLMEKVIKMYGKKVVRILTTQHRMNNIIMKWSSDKMYDGKLIADGNVKAHVLADLNHVEKNKITKLPLLTIDTAGCNMSEHKNKMSKGNHWEAGLVRIHVNRLIQSGVKQKEIAVITPYKLQVELIKQALHHHFPNIEVQSVDGFQGRESEAVILSLVRSSSKGGVGFLRDERRLNVATTRPRRHLAVICDSQTMARNKFLESFVESAKKNGGVEKANKFKDQLKVMVPSTQVTHKTKKKGNKNNKSTKISKEDSKNGTKLIGLDCEMVGIGEDGTKSILARISLVNQAGQPIYDKYVKPSEIVTDYRTDVSGITPENLVAAEDFKIVKKEVTKILKGKLLIGHGLMHDMEVLKLNHPTNNIRDTSMYSPFVATFGGKTPSLKKLATKMLKKNVQSGMHCSVEDAATAMKIYNKVKYTWEESVKERAIAFKKSKVAETVRG